MAELYNLTEKDLRIIHMGLDFILNRSHVRDADIPDAETLRTYVKRVWDNESS